MSMRQQPRKHHATGRWKYTGELQPYPCGKGAHSWRMVDCNGNGTLQDSPRNARCPAVPRDPASTGWISRLQGPPTSRAMTIKHCSEGTSFCQYCAFSLEHRG